MQKNHLPVAAGDRQGLRLVTNDDAPDLNMRLLISGGRQLRGMLTARHEAAPPNLGGGSHLADFLLMILDEALAARERKHGLPTIAEAPALGVRGDR